MGELTKKAKAKIDKGVSNVKKILSLMMVWGLIFSLVTIGRLRVAFDYDDTLVFSTPAMNKAYASGAIPASPQFWTIVNQSYDVEKPKWMTHVIAWAFRLAGFQPAILASRPPYGGEALKKEWRHLAPRFVFVAGADAKKRALAEQNYVLFFGDSDTDIKEARAAHVFPVRIRRSRSSIFKEDYHPGSLHELVLPFSEY